VGSDHLARCVIVHCSPVSFIRYRSFGLESGRAWSSLSYYLRVGCDVLSEARARTARARARLPLGEISAGVFKNADVVLSIDGEKAVARGGAVLEYGGEFTYSVSVLQRATRCQKYVSGMVLGNTRRVIYGRRSSR